MNSWLTGALEFACVLLMFALLLGFYTFGSVILETTP